MKTKDYLSNINTFIKTKHGRIAILSGIAFLTASIITVSALAAISQRGQDERTDSAIADRVKFEASFPMAVRAKCTPAVSPSITTTPTPTPSTSPTDEAAAIEAAIKSPEAAVKPETGSVFTSSEYKYDSKEDAVAVKAEKEDDSSSNTITAIIPASKPASKPASASTPSPTATPSAASTPQQTPSATPKPEQTPSATPAPEQAPSSTPTAEPSAEPSQPSPTTEVTAEPTTETTPSPSPTEPVYADGWNIIKGHTYYYVNGDSIKGWADIEGFRYYFNQSTGAKESRVGIDVSSYQGTINWKSVKNAGVDFAIIRAGFRGYGSGKLCVDPNFEQNIKGALAAGIECGVYIYSAAIDEIEGAQEGNFLINAIQGYNITGPLVIDTECTLSRTASLTREQRTNIAIAGLEAIKASGHKAMLYTGHSFYNNNLNFSRLTSYPLWIAHYTSDYNKVSNVPYKIWQYTSSGSVPGISGKVDLNIWK